MDSLINLRMKPSHRKRSLCSEIDNSRFTSISGESPGPGSKAPDKKTLLSRRDTKENNLNIKEEEKPQKQKHVPRGSGKHSVTSHHGESKPDVEKKKGKVTPVERIDREDSGYDENHPAKKKVSLAYAIDCKSVINIERNVHQALHCLSQVNLTKECVISVKLNRKSWFIIPCHTAHAPQSNKNGKQL